MGAAAVAGALSAACLAVDPPGTPGRVLFRRCWGPVTDPLLAVRAAVLCTESRRPAGLASLSLDKAPPPAASPALGLALMGA